MPFGFPLPKPPSPWELIGWVVTTILDGGAVADGTPPPWEDDNRPRPKPVADPKEKPPSTETPIPPADNPPAPNPAPPPRKPYDPPVSIPVPTPLPPMPEPVFPTEIDLDQKEHKISHAKRESLVTRKYGCMLFEPVREQITVVECSESPEVFWNAFAEAQQEAIRAFMGWLLGWDKLTPEQRQNDPNLAAFGELLALDLISLNLTDKVCELAYVALTLTTRGAFNKLVSAQFFVMGCAGLIDLMLWWSNRNKTTITAFPVIYNTYKFINSVGCIQPEITPSTGVGSVVDYNLQPTEVTSLVIPDPGDYENTEGKFMQIYWSFEDGTKKNYGGMTQLHSPIPELWDCLDSNGDPDPTQVSNLEGNWETYFEPLHRTIGYVEAKLFGKGRKAPISTGWFIDKDDAKQYFQELTKLTLLVPREHNNPVYYEYPDEILFDDPETENEADTGEIPKPASLKRKIDNAGKKIIPRKVVIGERQSTVSEPRVLVEYYNSKILIPPNGT